VFSSFTVLALLFTVQDVHPALVSAARVLTPRASVANEDISRRF
jgi:hypothetical protein